MIINVISMLNATIEVPMKLILEFINELHKNHINLDFKIEKSIEMDYNTNSIDIWSKEKCEKIIRFCNILNLNKKFDPLINMIKSVAISNSDEADAGVQFQPETFRLDEALPQYLKYGLFVRRRTYTQEVLIKDCGSCYIMDNLSELSGQLFWWYNGYQYPTYMVVPYLRKDLSESEKIQLDRIKQMTLERYHNDHSRWYQVKHQFYVKNHVDDFDLLENNLAIKAPDWMYSKPVGEVDEILLRDLAPIPGYF